jgi:CheY-like chemotaxis protein
VAEQRILIVDSSEAFATMLKEGVESSGPYKAIIVTSGTDALDVLVRDQIDLAIVDMGLEDMAGLALVQSLRQARPDLRIMLIPLFGQELTEEELSLEVQGVLPKPFFIDDLPGLIQGVLMPASGEKEEVAAKVPVEALPKPRSEPPPVPRPASRETFASRDVNVLLEELFQEVRAEAVLFVRDPDLIAHAGNVTRERAQELAGLAVESMNAAHKMAAFLGETDDRFGQCTFEGDEYSVYSVNVTSNTILSVALSARAPVGIIRYNLRRLADALADIWYE